MAAGVETLRLRAASDVVLQASSPRRWTGPERKQAVVEVQILPVDSVLLARTSDQAFQKRVDLPDGMKIVADYSRSSGADPRAVRRSCSIPVALTPQIAIELVNHQGSPQDRRASVRSPDHRARCGDG